MEASELYLFVGSTVISFCAFTLNFIVASISLQKRLVDGEYRWFILSEAIADASFCIIMGVVEPIYMFNPHYLFYPSCALVGYLMCSTGTTSMTILPFISFNRYISLHHSGSYSRFFRLQNISLMMFAAFVLSFSAYLPFYFLGYAGRWASAGICCIEMVPEIEVILAFTNVRFHFSSDPAQQTFTSIFRSTESCTLTVSFIPA